MRAKIKIKKSYQKPGFTQKELKIYTTIKKEVNWDLLVGNYEK